MTTATFTSAARSFAALVREIPAGAWDGPGLGEWDRSRAGRTHVALTDHREQLPADHRRARGHHDTGGVLRAGDPVGAGNRPRRCRRARAAGRQRSRRGSGGDDRRVGVTGDWAIWLTSDNPLIEVIGGLGIRLHTYLPTRVFELAVHGLDIAEVAQYPHVPPPEACSTRRLGLATRTAVATGHGETVLLALTGRITLAAVVLGGVIPAGLRCNTCDPEIERKRDALGS